MTRLLIALMLLCSTAGAQVKPAVMARQQAGIDYAQSPLHGMLENKMIAAIIKLRARVDSLEAQLQVMDYRITGLWVENKRLQERVDSLEAKISRLDGLLMKRSFIRPLPNLEVIIDSMPLQQKAKP